MLLASYVFANFGVSKHGTVFAINELRIELNLLRQNTIEGEIRSQYISSLIIKEFCRKWYFENHSHLPISQIVLLVLFVAKKYIYRNTMFRSKSKKWMFRSEKIKICVHKFVLFCLVLIYWGLRPAVCCKFFRLRLLNKYLQTWLEEQKLRFNRFNKKLDMKICVIFH